MNGLNLFIKCDDCIGLVIGGNKICKFEFLMGEVMCEGVSMVVI